MEKNPIPATSNPKPFGGSAAAPDRLDSWKEIASYLGREVRTVQLWEKNEGLPVHRHFHKQLGSVFGFRSEIESWSQQASRRRLNGKHQTGPEASKAEAKSGPRITIQILPLRDNAASTEHRQLCDLITARTVSGLTQLDPERLSIVAAELSCSQEADQTADRRSADAALDYLLRWSIQEDDADGLVFNAALLQAATEALAWSHSYRCHPENFGETPGYVADQIVQCLWLKLISSPASRSSARHREKPGSREAYLKGRYFWNQRNEESLRKAVHCFESAIQADPDFALPYSGLADSLTLLSFYEIVSPSEAMPSARRAALKSIELDPNLAEAHASLADVLLHFDRDWQGADYEYRRAIQCNPDYALGYHWYANLLAAKGQHEAAHIAIMHALEIDPVSLITVVWAGVTSHLAHRFDEAIGHYQSALELNPQFIWAHMYMAQTLEQKGNFKEALREFETTIQLAGGSNCVKAMKAHAHAIAGDKSSALRILQEIKGAPSPKCMPSYDIAATYAALGESQQTMVWLNRACNERNMKLFTLIQDPRFDLLRDHTEFQQIVAQMGLSQYSPARPLAVL